MSTEKLKPATTYPSIVGRILGNIRGKHGLDQVKLARKIGITQSTLSRVERGESALTIEQLAKATRELGTTPGEILALADRAANEFEAQGIRVEPEKPKNELNSGIVLIGAAAITALIAVLLTKK